LDADEILLAFPIIHFIIEKAVYYSAPQRGTLLAVHKWFISDVPRQKVY